MYIYIYIYIHTYIYRYCTYDISLPEGGDSSHCQQAAASAAEASTVGLYDDNFLTMCIAARELRFMLTIFIYYVNYVLTMIKTYLIIVDYANNVLAMFIALCVYVYIYIYIYKCVCIYIYIYIYIHICIYIYIYICMLTS